MRYYVATELPATVRSAEFAELDDSQIRLRLEVRDGLLRVIAHGSDPAACEALLRGLGAREIGVDLCG